MSIGSTGGGGSVENQLPIGNVKVEAGSQGEAFKTPEEGEAVLKDLDSAIKDAQEHRNGVTDQEMGNALEEWAQENDDFRKKLENFSSELDRLMEGADDEQKAQLQELKKMLKSTQSLLSALTRKTNSQLASKNLDDEGDLFSERSSVPNSDVPEIAQAKQEQGEQVNTKEGNQFLAKAFITAVFELQLELFKQLSLNKDMERAYKVLSLENQYEFQKLSAEFAKLAKEMDAKSMFAQAIGQLAGAGLGMAMLGGMCMRGNSMLKDTQKDKTQLYDNGENYNQAAATKHNEANGLNGEGAMTADNVANGDIPINDELAATHGQEPGLKQLQARKENIQNELNQGGDGGISAERRGELQTELDGLNTRIQKKQEQVDGFSVSQQWSSKMWTDSTYMLLQQGSRSIDGLSQSIGGMIGSSFKMKGAEFEMMQMLMNAAGDMASKMFQSAQEAFGGEQRMIDAVFQLLQTMSQKVSEWSRYSRG